MGSPFVHFLAHPSGAPLARFAPIHLNQTDTRFWQAMAPHLPPEAYLPYIPQDGDFLDPPLLGIFCAPLAAYQTVEPKKYALAVAEAAHAVPQARIFRPRELAFHGKSVPVDLVKEAKPWGERLFDEKEALHLAFYPMYQDLRGTIIDIISAVMAQLPANETASLTLQMLLYEDEEGMPRFRLKDPEANLSHRGINIALEVNTGDGTEPSRLGIGAKILLAQADKGTLLQQELVGLVNHLFWIFDNYNETKQSRSAGWLRRGDTLQVAGTGIKIKLGE